MSNQFNAARMAYLNMDIENLPKEKVTEDTGLLRRKVSPSNAGLDYKNPAVRVAKQLEVIRNYRNQINGTSE
jgi:hypothetical protein